MASMKACLSVRRDSKEVLEKYSGIMNIRISGTQGLTKAKNKIPIPCDKNMVDRFKLHCFILFD
jgi:hypothetical protein